MMIFANYIHALCIVYNVVSNHKRILHEINKLKHDKVNNSAYVEELEKLVMPLLDDRLSGSIIKNVNNQVMSQILNYIEKIRVNTIESVSEGIKRDEKILDLIENEFNRIDDIMFEHYYEDTINENKGEFNSAMKRVSGYLKNKSADEIKKDLDDCGW